MKFRKYSILILAGAFFSLFESASSASSYVIQDSTFNDAGWTSLILPYSNPGLNLSFSRTQILSGGSPAAYQETTLNWTATGGSSQRIYVANLMNGATYSPSSEGAIKSIDFSYDSILLRQIGGTPDPYNTLVLLQSGSYYFRFTNDPTNTLGWVGHSYIGLLASDFSLLSGTGPTLPNFSASGGTIQFGYIDASGSVYPGTISIISGLDNYSVSINAVPVPAAFWLVGSALISFIGFNYRNGRKGAQ